MTNIGVATAAATRPGLICSARLNLAFVMFLGCVVLYALRGNISFALVCMVENEDIEKPTFEKCQSNSTVFDYFVTSKTSSNVPQNKKEFNWSKNVQGIILSAFFWGYLTSQILGGYLAQRIGAKRVVGFAIFSSSILTLLSPIAARMNVSALIVLRVILGFLQGSVFPAMHSMWALWAPPLERGLLTSISYAGSQIGIVIMMPFSGVLCQHGVDGGWPSIFYLFGIAGIVWFVIWTFTVADTPKKHRRITKHESEYIFKALNPIENDTTEECAENKQTSKRFPIYEIMTSKPVWACFIGHCAGDWGAYTMATGLPLFMNDALKLDIITMGLISTIPYIFNFIMINVSGLVADFLQKNQTFSTLNTRRSAMIIALCGQAFFLILIGYLDCSQKFLLIILLTASLGISGFQYSAYIVNYLEICSGYAGAVLGIGQTLSCLSGIFSSLAIGYLTPTGSHAEWQQVFHLSAFILVVGSIFFSLFASDSIQPWACANYQKKNIEKIQGQLILSDSLLGKEPIKKTVVLLESLI